MTLHFIISSNSVYMKQGTPRGVTGYNGRGIGLLVNLSISMTMVDGSSRSLTKKSFLINILCTILLFIICFLFFIITIFYYFLLLFLVRVEVQHLATEQYIDSILLKVYHLLSISHQMKKKLLLCSSAMRIPLKISNLYMNLDINFSLKIVCILLSGTKW